MEIGASRKTSTMIFCTLAFVVQRMMCGFCVCVCVLSQFFAAVRGRSPFHEVNHGSTSRLKPVIGLRRVNFVVESALCALCRFSFEIVRKLRWSKEAKSMLRSER